jgi:deoxycytidine triphosphate deaminase
MILSSNDIMQELGYGVEIRDFDPDQLNQNSYDVHLGQWFARLSYQGTEPHYELVVLDYGDTLYLPGGETILAMTQDIAGGRGDVTAMIKAKSTTRRLGISTCDDAGLGEPGYIDHWTLELTANTSTYAPVEVGMKVAQLVFHRLESLPLTQYDGQYTAHWPVNMVPKQWRANITYRLYGGPGMWLR